MTGNGGPFEMCIWITRAVNRWKVAWSGILDLQLDWKRNYRVDIRGNASRSDAEELDLMISENKEKEGYFYEMMGSASDIR